MSFTSTSRNVVVDLFAGAGGLGMGAELAGGELTLSVENDVAACNTLELNKTSGFAEVVMRDLTEIGGDVLRKWSGARPTDRLIVVGGPPCQPFSKAAYWTEEGNDAKYRRLRSEGNKNLTKPPKLIEPRSDERRSLVQHFSRLVIQSKADGFVFENVPSIMHPRNKPILEDLTKELSAYGYHIQVVKLNAVAFGVAQKRERIFVLGSRVKMPKIPIGTHNINAENGMEDLDPMPTTNAVLRKYSSEQYFEAEEVVVGKWAEHLRTVPPGGNYKAHTAWGGHPEPTFVAETRFWNFLLKLDPNKPSWTIAANPGPWTGPFHWESRRLRIPELAALQGFPENYKFYGSRKEQVRQIGNAVAVPVAKAAVTSVIASFKI